MEHFTSSALFGVESDGNASVTNSQLLEPVLSITTHTEKIVSVDASKSSEVESADDKSSNLSDRNDGGKFNETENSSSQESLSDDFNAGARYWTDPMAGKVCFTCGKRGHLRTECSIPTPCFLCGSYDHQANQCVSGSCFNCSRPGHQKNECPRSMARFYCKRCDLDGHSEGECPDIWCEYVWDEEWRPDKRRRAIRRFCYVCAEEGHFGDDCDARGLLRGVSRFSTTAFKSDDALLSMGYRGKSIPFDRKQLNRNDRDATSQGGPSNKRRRPDNDDWRRDERDWRRDQQKNHQSSARFDSNFNSRPVRQGTAAGPDFRIPNQLPFYQQPMAPPMRVVQHPRNMNTEHRNSHQNNHRNSVDRKGNGRDRERAEFKPRYRGGYQRQ